MIGAIVAIILLVLVLAERFLEASFVSLAVHWTIINAVIASIIVPFVKSSCW